MNAVQMLKTVVNILRNSQLPIKKEVKNNLNLDGYYKVL
jgi:hypothetical protein